MRVLIIEALKDARTLLCDYLRTRGVECVAVDSMAAGIEGLQTVRPDVVVAEWFMNRLEDAEEVTKLRAAANELGAGIVILSTTPRPAKFPEVERYLTKPAALDLLFDTIVGSASSPGDGERN